LSEHTGARQDDFMTSPDGSSGNTAVALLLLATLALAGCSQHQGVPISEETANADQHLPFDGASDKGGIFPTGSLTPTAIPAGTPIEVRLRTSLSSATSQAGDSFEAVLDEPVFVRGRVVAPRGAVVAGKVLDAKASAGLQEPGYMRLALVSVSLNGQTIPIQTSNIFVKRGSHREQGTNMLARSPIGGVPVETVLISKASISKGPTTTSQVGNAQGTLKTASTGQINGFETDSAIENNDVGVSADRRLTFRLAQSLPL
jgi:hypothetical protein